MSLTDKIKESIIHDLSHKELRMFSSYNEFERQVVKGLLDAGSLTESELDSALETAVVSRAEQDCKYLLDAQKKSENVYPDHAVMPEFLAYAIQNNKVRGSWTSVLRFDHGQNALSFAERYCPENLISKLRQRLFNPEKLPVQKEEDYDPHPVCPCGH